MKPKSKIQKEVVALSATLPPLTLAQQQWAYAHCFPHIAHLSKSYVWCSECGRQVRADIPELSATLGVDKNITCPCCGARLKVKVSRKRHTRDKVYYQVITTCKGYQVVRNFIATRYVEIGAQPCYDIHEAVQNWINEDGHEEVIARPTNYCPSGCYDNWDFSKPMELRTKRRTHDCWGYYTEKYDIGGAWIYPRRNLLPVVKRNGYTGRNALLPENEHIKLLLTDRQAEALEKNSQFALLAYKYKHDIGEYRFRHNHAVSIAIRHRYIVRDASMWADYLDLLDYFHMDTHNPHYVCPRNLKQEHDRLQRRKARIEAQREREERIRRAAEAEEEYRRTKGRYFGITFTGGDITVSVLTSVAQIAEEGKIMHHCVYDAGYYKRKDSLILSARDTATGRRIETIEVSLKTFRVVQSRAVCNKTSDRHEQILDLLDRNMNLIRRAAGAA